MFFHWQNLNEKKDGSLGWGLRYGRCWWHFRGQRDRVINLEWNLWSRHCGIGMDFSDEDLTFSFGFPPIGLYLSFSTTWSLVWKLAPKRYLYGGASKAKKDDFLVVDQREIGVTIHNGRVWIKPWCKLFETNSADPWWVRGISFSINPFELIHQRNEVRRADGSWEPFAGSWEDDKTPDRRETFEFPYTYVLKNGTVQNRIATVYVERRAWRPRCLQWTKLFEKERTSIDVQFNEEVGERAGSWKGGCTGCGWDMLPGETPEETLRRMEGERVFD